MSPILSGPSGEELGRHNREMQRAGNYIRSKHEKTEFEPCVIDNCRMFYDQALEAVQGIRELWPGVDELLLEGTGPYNIGKCLKLGPYQEDQDVPEAAEVQSPVEKDRKPPYLYRGDLDQHHVLMEGNYTAIIEYNRMHLRIQISDLYRFMCKIMERHGRNLDLGLPTLDSYKRVLLTEPEGRGCLHYLFLYLERYRKRFNFYYNANEAWIPARNTSKLWGLEGQQQARNSFLKHLKADCKGCV